MALANYGYFNNLSPGAPALTNVAGDMYTLIHYALTTISNWTRTFNAGTPNFRAVWQPAAGGTSPVLVCKDNATDSGDQRLCVVRLAESASAVTTYTDPVPQVAQVADSLSNWLKNTTTTGAARDYHCVVWATGIILAIKTSGSTDVWDLFFACKSFIRFTSV